MSKIKLKRSMLLTSISILSTTVVGANYVSNDQKESQYSPDVQAIAKMHMVGANNGLKDLTESQFFHVDSNSDQATVMSPEELGFSFYMGKAQAWVDESAKAYMPAVNEFQVVVEPTVVKETLAERLFKDHALMDQLEALPQAMEYLRSLKLTDELRQNIVQGLEKKIEAVHLASKQFEESQTESLMYSRIGSRLTSEVAELDKKLQKALGSLAPEFNNRYGLMEIRPGVYAAAAHAECVLKFLNKKLDAMKSNAEKSLFRQAAESVFLDKLGMTDYTVEETLVRGTGNDKEFAGVVLCNQTTGQILLVMADGTSRLMGVKGMGTADSNTGLSGKGDRFDRYETVNLQIYQAVKRLTDVSRDAGDWNLITTGKDQGAVDALQAAYNMNVHLGKKVQVGTVGFNMQSVYDEGSAKKVEKTLGKGNIVYNRQQTGLGAMYDKDIVGLVMVGESAKQPVVASEVPAEEPGYFTRAVNWVKSWF